MLYVYALVEPPAVLPDVRGIEGGRPELADVDGIAAAVAEIARPVLDASEDAVLAHARVVDALAGANAAVLPVRFGRALADLDAVRAAVAASAPALHAALARVRGCVELALRVLVAEPADAEASPSSSGCDYMRRRLASLRDAERLADELHAPLAALARASTRSVLATPRLLLSAAYLVPRETVDEFRRRLDELAAARPALSVACTGPWPPYSFATAEVGAG